MLKNLLGIFSGVNALHLGLAALAIATLAGGAGFGAGWMVNGWRLGVDVAELKGDKRELEIGAHACGRALETQNQAIAGWKAAAAEAKGKGAAAQRQAQTLVTSLQPELERLIGLAGEKAVEGVALTCADAVATVREGLWP